MGKRINKIEDLTHKSWTGRNKVAREKLARKLGVKVEEINTYVGAKWIKESVEAPKISGEKPTIHTVVILDNSGSMKGEKFNNAYQGVKNELEMLKQDTT